MLVNFKKITLHNFLSFGHSEIELEDKNYCMVKGVNKCIRDNSLSNGSGKSSIWSGICYALTGETIQGISSNLKNINVDEDECYVKLLFKLDNNEIEVTRIHKPKSDMKVIVNGQDKSGKGIRESEVILEQYLQDLNKELLSSVIILGQGLPNKLSKLNPSGRKERLEKLSKSDFMIEDIKNRINTRQSKLNDDMKELDTIIVKVNTQIELFGKQLEQVNSKLMNLPEVTSLRDKMVMIEQELPINRVSKETLEKEVNELTEFNKQVQEVIIKKTEEMNEELQNENNCFQDAYKPVMENKANIYAQSNNLYAEIKKLKEITGICPTCGQPLPNVTKIDTTEKEKEYSELIDQLKDVENKISLMNEKHNRNQKEIRDEFQLEINKNKLAQQDYLRDLSSKNGELRTLTESISSKEKEYERLKAECDNHTKLVEDLNNQEKNIKEDIEVHNNKLTNYNKDKDDLQQHIDVIKKMDTLVKRDFRGYLLQNVIDYIDMKCKEYSSIVFETDKLDFKLDGNNIAITYDDKPMENLSGGEQQRVDIILQLAIRDMMSKYLNFSSNILVLDEIFDNLDAKATGKILDLISTIDDVNSLFIISHHDSDLEISYDNEITVYKNEYGISEVV